MKERQRMRLGDLRQIHQPPKLFGGGWDLHRQDLVAGGGRRQQMAHRADAADARRDARHLGERPALAEFLKAPVLRHVEAGRVHGAAVIQVDRDLGVPLNAGHRIDRDRAAGGLVGVSCVVRRHELLIQSSAEADLIAAAQLRPLAPQQRLESGADPLGWRRAARHIHLHRHELMHRQHPLQ